MERPRTTANIDYNRFSEVWDLSLMVDGGRGWLFHSFHPLYTVPYDQVRIVYVSTIYDDQKSVEVSPNRSR